MKKLITLVLATSLLLILGLPVQAEELNQQPNEVGSFYEGVTPIKTYYDKNTGIVADVYIASEIQTFNNGVWDLVGTSWYVPNGIMDDRYTKLDIVHSTGGDFMIRIKKHTLDKVNASKPLLAMKLYEDDPVDDDLVSSLALDEVGYVVSDIDVVFRKIGKYVDGTNKKAEFYALVETNYTTKGAMKFEFYD